MTKLTFGKRDIEDMADTLDGDYKDVNEAAQAVLDAALEILERRAKFTVVGQVYEINGKPIAPTEPLAAKVCLGFYSTEGNAQAAADQLGSLATGERHLTWVLEVLHMSPHELSTIKREEIKMREKKRTEKRKEKIRKSIEERQQLMQDIADAARRQESLS